jgi:hypothetical protein
LVDMDYVQAACARVGVPETSPDLEMVHAGFQMFFTVAREDWEDARTRSHFVLGQQDPACWTIQGVCQVVRGRHDSSPAAACVSISTIGEILTFW